MDWYQEACRARSLELGKQLAVSLCSLLDLLHGMLLLLCTGLLLGCHLAALCCQLSLGALQGSKLLLHLPATTRSQSGTTSQSFTEV